MDAAHKLLSIRVIFPHYSFHNDCYPCTSFKMDAIHTLLSKWMLSEKQSFQKWLLSIHSIHIFLSKYLLYNKHPFSMTVVHKWTSSGMTALCGFFSPSTQRMLTRIEMKLVALQSTARKFVLKQHFSLSYSGTIARKLLMCKLEKAFLNFPIVQNMQETRQFKNFYQDRLLRFSYRIDYCIM